MAGTVLFPNVLSTNTLTHLCPNDFDFCAYCKLGQPEIAKIIIIILFFILDPKPRKFKIKLKDGKISRFVASQIMGGLYKYRCMHLSDKHIKICRLIGLPR